MTQGVYTRSNSIFIWISYLLLWTNTLKSWATPSPQVAGAQRTPINAWKVAIVTPVQLTSVHPFFPLLKCALPSSVPHYLLLLTGLIWGVWRTEQGEILQIHHSSRKARLDCVIPLGKGKVQIQNNIIASMGNIQWKPMGNIQWKPMSFT